MPGETPAEARRAAGVTARHLADSARAARQRIERGNRTVAAIERELSGAGVSTTRRRVLLAQIKFIRASEGAVALSVAGSPRIPQLGLADRAVDALRPGGAPRPEPIWAGFAGLLTGLALCALWLLVRPIR